MKKIRPLKSVKDITVPAHVFIEITESRRENIESTRFIAPKVGGKGFGTFKINFRDKELINQ